MFSFYAVEIATQVKGAFILGTMATINLFVAKTVETNAFDHDYWKRPKLFDLL